MIACLDAGWCGISHTGDFIESQLIIVSHIERQLLLGWKRENGLLQFHRHLVSAYAWILFMEERYADAKTYIDQALKNRDSTADNSTVIEHAGDIYYMNGMADESVDFWKKAYTGENQTEVLAWKIKNRQYITGEELKKRNASKQKPAATKKSVRKGKKK